MYTKLSGLTWLGPDHKIGKHGMNALNCKLYATEHYAYSRALEKRVWCPQLQPQRAINGKWKLEALV
jgi:hypothetical protein